MGDLETTIVIDPAIPLTDITELERLVLSSVFDAGEVDNALLLYTDSGAALTFSLAAGDLSVAYETSRRSPKSELNRIVAECWRDQIDGRDRIEIDLRPSSWEFILCRYRHKMNYLEQHIMPSGSIKLLNRCLKFCFHSA